MLVCWFGAAPIKWVGELTMAEPMMTRLNPGGLWSSGSFPLKVYKVLDGCVVYLVYSRLRA